MVCDVIKAGPTDDRASLRLDRLKDGRLARCADCLLTAKNQLNLERDMFIVLFAENLFTQNAGIRCLYSIRRPPCAKVAQTSEDIAPWCKAIGELTSALPSPPQSFDLAQRSGIRHEQVGDRCLILVARQLFLIDELQSGDSLDSLRERSNSAADLEDEKPLGRKSRRVGSQLQSRWIATQYLREAAKYRTKTLALAIGGIRLQASERLLAFRALFPGGRRVAV